MSVLGMFREKPATCPDFMLRRYHVYVLHCSLTETNNFFLCPVCFMVLSRQIFILETDGLERCTESHANRKLRFQTVHTVFKVVRQKTILPVTEGVRRWG